MSNPTFVDRYRWWLFLGAFAVNTSFVILKYAMPSLRGSIRGRQCAVSNSSGGGNLWLCGSPPPPPMGAGRRRLSKGERGVRIPRLSDRKDTVSNGLHEEQN